MLRVEQLDVEVAVLAALTGSYRAEVTVDGFELAARQAADGSWDVESLAREEEPDAGPDDAGDDGGPGTAPPEPEPLPDLDVSVALRDGRVVLHGLDGTSELEDVTLDLALEGGGLRAGLDADLVLEGLTLALPPPRRARPPVPTASPGSPSAPAPNGTRPPAR